MLLHNLNYTLKTLFRDKMLIFWTFAFPLILGTFFSLAFSNIEKSEQLDIIEIAVIKNEAYENRILLKEAIRTLSDEKNEDQLFHTKYVTEEKAKKLLQEEKIAGYIIVKDTPKVVVMTNGIDQTIIKQVVEEITTKEATLGQIVAKRMEQYSQEQSVEGIKNYNLWYASMNKEINEILEKDTTIKDASNKNLSYTMIEFYTLIAMTCLYGGILGMIAINRNLANMSNKGKRVAVSKTPKVKLILSSALAAYITQLIGILLLFLYTIFVLKVDYGNHLFYCLLLAIIGCLAGLSLGIAIATLFKSSENTKIGIIISVTMLGCFLSGMMGITMKYIVDKNIPIINIINPASRITDGFYCLYYYDTLDRFYGSIISLLVFASIMFIISVWSLRRQQYDSI